MRIPILLAFAMVFASGWLAGATGPSIPDLKRMIKVLRPLHYRLGPPKPGDWLYGHAEEGQSFTEYLGCKPVMPTRERGKLYVQPLGTFSPGQQHVLELVVEGMGLYLCLPVTVLSAKPTSAIPARARRTTKESGEMQFLTTYILHELLEPNLPDDAAACIALTATDLWPGKGWNFVFGQASIQDRIGVWSIARLGFPDAGAEPFRLCLLRALGTAVHETCHMFSFSHCTAYECAMCGSNSLGEGDRHPLWLCPQCLAKLCYAVHADPVVRYRGLEGFCKRNGLLAEAAFYQRSAEVLERTWRKGSP